MTPHTHEQTINTALGEVLDGLGQNWTIYSEELKVFEDGGRPDLLVERPDGWPITIEAEVGNHRQADAEARSRLGLQLTTSGSIVRTSVAVVYPTDLRSHSGAALRKAVSDASLEYALLSESPDGPYRFPESGWLEGSVVDLALLLHRASIPAWQVISLANTLETGIARAERALTTAHPVGSALGTALADVLGQSDDEAGQTRRMAMTVIINALIFHAALAEVEMEVPDGPDSRTIRSPRAFRSGGRFLPTPLTDEWARILEVNYWPIFHSAAELIRAMPTASAASTLETLWETAEKLIAGGVTRSHDLTGIVFQRLIADRKFLATFYTRPAAASLLAGLAMPLASPPSGPTGWGDAAGLSDLRLGDFACGTGTLLSTAYQRLSVLHELYGGDPKALHPSMMKEGLVGLDVLNLGVHLTAAMLAGTYPNTPFEGECLLTMPHGEHAWGVSVGSLDLLDEQPSFDVIQAAAVTAGGRGEKEARDLLRRVGHGEFQVVIMNPPFTRHGAREGDRTLVHNPAFAAFEADEALQDRLSTHLRHLARGGSAHGHAGLASYFADLAHRKAAQGGIVALVLPLSAMSGGSWEKVRDLFRAEYSSLTVVTIAESGTHTRSFSADTGMAECLLIGRKERKEGQARAVFAVLEQQPRTTLEGEQIANSIATTVAKGEVRRLEDGPFGGTRLSLGSTFIGEVIDCPLPVDGPWQMVGIRDFSLGQTAHQLREGRIWVEGMAEGDAVSVPVASIGDICSRIGPHDLDITGARIKGDGLPQGPFEKIDGCSPGAAYPTLWNHDTTRERRLIVQPDSHCQLRDVNGAIPERLRQRAQERWATAARSHYNRDLRFNSQSLVVATTERPSLGGRAWPTVVFDDGAHEWTFALWSNSTLGLLAHWWMANKSQEGRGSVTIVSIPFLTTLDVRTLTKEQHAAAAEAFGALRDSRLLPFDQIDEDPARAELDRALLVDVLGLPANLCETGGPLDLLRRKLAAEPQIHSDKQTKVVFTEDGETAVPR